MPQQVNTAVENNFTKGLLTEFTGLNFPENATTDTDNCVYGLIGDVTRRLGIDYEENFTTTGIVGINVAKNTYKWNNAGGQGETQIVVTQIGNVLQFYLSSSATESDPLSNQILLNGITVTDFLPNNSPFGSEATQVECQFTDGNGYLFVFHPYCDPFYCTFTGQGVIAAKINVRIRDYVGAIETGLADTTRPTVTTGYHTYNLLNQGWTAQGAWNTSSTTIASIAVGQPAVFQVQAALPIVIGQPVNIDGSFTRYDANSSAPGGQVNDPGQVFGVATSYVGTTLTVTVGSYTGFTQSGTPIAAQFYIRPGASQSYITAWQTAVGNYPSNADVWWRFKNSSDVFAPATTIGNVTLSSPAPKGSIILDAFNQDPTAETGLLGMGKTTTFLRPRNGCWFQGRVFYTGVDDSQLNAGPVGNNNYTWTENVYFSQVVVKSDQFGKCYKQNDPTSENLFDDLPTDGGVLTVQGCGSIYKLFPIQNGLLVFAANGIYFITGSQGIGFSATDYTITRISEIQSISANSFVNVQGFPFFWNEEGIYQVTPGEKGGLTVNSLSVSTIDSFYNDIPQQCKRYARGAYDPINYIITWIYRDNEAETVDNKFEYNRALNFNTVNKAFFPWTFVGNANVNSIIYVTYPGGLSNPDPIIKYFVSDFGQQYTFAEQRDDRYVDFASEDGGVPFESYFLTGYKIRGQGIRQYQPQYIQVYSRVNEPIAGYKFQGIWDYAVNRNANRNSSSQVVNIVDPNQYFSHITRRHKIRGHGYALQFKISSLANTPFDIIGWVSIDTTNQGA